MTLDKAGVQVRCSTCGTMNRLRFEGLNRAARCGKCRADVPFPAAPIDATSVLAFDAAIALSSIPVVVDFWAAWCGPCRMVAPEIAKVAQRMAGRALVLKVDTDALAELGGRYGIRSIPTIMVFDNGREATRVAGVRPAAAIEQLVPQATASR